MSSFDVRDIFREPKVTFSFLNGMLHISLADMKVYKSQDKFTHMVYYDFQGHARLGMKEIDSCIL